MNKGGIILCIDDNPNEVIEKTSKSLQDTVREIFKDYEVIFAQTGQEGLNVVGRNNNVRLVLLDIQFTKQQMQGSEIADSLFDINPQLKIIVLTKFEETGKKRSFGWKDNVTGYIVKKDIANPGNKELLRNLAEAVIKDPENKKWTLYLDTDIKKATLQKDVQKFFFSIPRSKRKWLLLEACANNPNECVKSVDIEGFIQLNAQYPEYVNKEVSEINKRVIQKTRWRTWGILDTNCDTSSSAKLVIGRVEIDNEKTPSYKRQIKSAAIQAQFEDFKKYIEERFNKLEEEIISLKKQT